MPHLHRDWAHPCHICPGTGLCRSYASSVLPLYPLTLLGTVSDQHGLPLRTRGTRLMVADAVCSPPRACARVCGWVGVRVCVCACVRVCVLCPGRVGLSFATVGAKAEPTLSATNVCACAAAMRGYRALSRR